VISCYSQQTLVKIKNIEAPVQPLRVAGFPRFQNKQHMKVKMSVLSTGRFYPEEVLISVRGWVDIRALVP
jgi:hypothetical protein